MAEFKAKIRSGDSAAGGSSSEVTLTESADPRQRFGWPSRADGVAPFQLGALAQGSDNVGATPLQRCTSGVTALSGTVLSKIFALCRGGGQVAACAEVCRHFRAVIGEHGADIWPPVLARDLGALDKQVPFGSDHVLHHQWCRLRKLARLGAHAILNPKRQTTRPFAVLTAVCGCVGADAIYAQHSGLPMSLADTRVTEAAMEVLHDVSRAACRDETMQGMLRQLDPLHLFRRFSTEIESLATSEHGDYGEFVLAASSQMWRAVAALFGRSGSEKAVQLIVNALRNAETSTAQKIVALNTLYSLCQSWPGTSNSTPASDVNLPSTSPLPTRCRVLAVGILVRCGNGLEDPSANSVDASGDGDKILRALVHAAHRLIVLGGQPAASAVWEELTTAVQCVTSAVLENSDAGTVLYNQSTILAHGSP